VSGAVLGKDNAAQSKTGPGIVKPSFQFRETTFNNTTCLIVMRTWEKPGQTLVTKDA
jgi:hypothetical protein